MADIPPVSDPQLAQILAQNQARRRRAIIIFTAVALVLAVGLGGSGLYFSAQAKKKRNIAYSRVIKCLFGTPLAAGEVPMTRVRAAWRARIFSATASSSSTMEEQEAANAKQWPNRCVTEMVAFTDTLKEIGEMKEGDKDLGFYSRELSKQTAGDNWKNVDTYQAAVEAFMTEADKGKFDFVDVPDVVAPETLAADSIDTLVPKSSAIEGRHIDTRTGEVVAGASAHFFLPANKGKPARLCMVTDGKSLECTEPVKGGLPPEAAGLPWVLGADDGAAPLLAFGWEGGITDGSSLAAGVIRSGDGLALVAPRAFYVAGGYSRADGTALLLLKPADSPAGDRFKIGHLAASASKLQLSDTTLADWNGDPAVVGLFGDQAVWIDSKNQLLARTVGDAEGPVQTIATLPGLPRHAFGRAQPFRACRTKTALVLVVPVEADGLPRSIVALQSGGAYGKAQVVDPGPLSCSDDAAFIVGNESIATCNVDGCHSEPRPEHRTTGPLHEWGEASSMVDGVVVRAERASGLLRVTWEKDKKTVATKVYDAQMKGTVLLGENKLGGVDVLSRRGYGLLVVDIDGTQHFARIDPAGTLAPVAVKEN